MHVEGKIKRILDAFTMLQEDSDARRYGVEHQLSSFNTVRHNDGSPKMKKELMTKSGQ
jgi:hypothetical protein